MDFYRALAATMDPLARRVDRDAPEGSEEEHALRGGTWLRQARACAALTAQPSDPVEYRATVRALRATAERPWPPTRRPGNSARSWGCWPGSMAPALVAQRGVGPVTGAQVLISWSHPGRLRSEAAFAMLAGVPPSRRPRGGWSATG